MQKADSNSQNEKQSSATEAELKILKEEVSELKMQMEYVKTFGFQPREFEKGMAEFRKETALRSKQEHQVVKVVEQRLHPMEKLQLIFIAFVFNALLMAFVQHWGQ